ncbi:MAG: AMP-binding protein [Promethearchaeota archaeon]
MEKVPIMTKNKLNTFKMSPFVEAVGIRAKYYPPYIPAIVYGNEQITWSELYLNTCRLANALKAKAKIKKGDKIAFIFHNSPQFLEINFASQMLGAVPVPINYRYIASEIEYTVNDCDAAILLCEEGILDEVLKIIDNLPKVRLFVADSEKPPKGFENYRDLINYNKEKEIKVPVTDDDIGVIIYTGGTTGRSKGVMLSNRNILTNQESIIRTFVLALPKMDLKCVKYAKNSGERKYLQAFDIFNSYFEGFFENQGEKDNILVLDVIGNDEVEDVSISMVSREGLIKLMIGTPEKEKIDVRVISNLDDQFRGLANLLPYVYTSKGRKKAMLKVLRLMLKGKIKIKGKLKMKIRVIKSLMKTSKAKDSDDRSDEFLSLLILPPMFHLAAYAFFLMFSTYAGGTCIIPKDTSFSAEKTLKMISTHRPKWMFLVPTMYKDILTYVEANPNHGYDISSVRIALSGAALLKGDDKKRLLKAFPNVIVVDAFGQTEMSAISAMKIDADPDKVKHGSVGKLGIGIEVKVVREDGSECEEGEIGELYYKGKCVMKGYYGDNEKTLRTIDKDGWLHSGDLGYLKDGELYTVDRKGECINTGAEKVFPIEVEEILHEHPSIKDVCIIGIPDEKWGKAVKAVVVIKDGKSLTEQELKDWCTGKMAGYKKPKVVQFIDNLPKSPVGKVLRGKIRKLYGEVKVND